LNAPAAEAEAPRKDLERETEPAAAQEALQRVRTELEQVRADAAAELAAVREQTRAAQSRAEQETTERTAERAAAQEALERARAECQRYLDGARLCMEERERAFGEAQAAADKGLRKAQQAASRPELPPGLPVPPPQSWPSTRRIENTHHRAAPDRLHPRSRDAPRSAGPNTA
jgi:hypothetical protein